MRPEARRRGSPFLSVNIVPHDEQVCRVQIPVPWLLNPVHGAGNIGHRQGKVGPVGLRSSPTVRPEIDAVTQSDKLTRAWGRSASR